MMNEVQKASNPKNTTPSSEPFRSKSKIFLYKTWGYIKLRFSKYPVDGIHNDH
jgi:hypothetical protein